MPWPIRFGPLPRMMTAGLLARRDLGLLVVAWSSGTGCARRTRPRRCRPSCRPGGCRAPGAAAGRRPRSTPRSSADLQVGEAVALGAPQQVGVELGGAAHLGGDLVDQRDLVEEPGVDAGGLVQPRRRWRRARAPAAPSVIRPSCGVPALLEQGRRRRSSSAVPREGCVGLLDRAQRLLQRLGNVASDRHRLTDALHVRGQRRVGRRGTSRRRTAEP